MIWNTIRRETGLIEHVDEMGVGHPNPASAYRMAFLTGQSFDAWMTHGCNGNCGRADFPGEVTNNVRSAFRHYIELGKLSALVVADPNIAAMLEIVCEHTVGFGGYGILGDYLCSNWFDLMDHEELRKTEYMFWPLYQLFKECE